MKSGLSFIGNLMIRMIIFIICLPLMQIHFALAVFVYVAIILAIKSKTNKE